MLNEGTLSLPLKAVGSASKSERERLSFGKELDAHFDVVFMYRLISLGSDQLLTLTEGTTLGTPIGILAGQSLSGIE